MRILSIDFDYFIDTDMYNRCMTFPDGNDNLEDSINDLIWSGIYNSNPQVKDIGVIKDYYKVCDYLRTLTKGKVLVSQNSHKDIEAFFNEIDTKEDLEVINIDFHHDMYITGGNTLDCANWLRILIDLKPNAKITWLRREDSDIESLSGTFPYNHTSNINNIVGFNEEFDLIFLCFSNPWTPPHLRPKYNKLCECCSHLDRF